MGGSYQDDIVANITIARKVANSILLRVWSFKVVKLSNIVAMDSKDCNLLQMRWPMTAMNNVGLPISLHITSNRTFKGVLYLRRRRHTFGEHKTTTFAIVGVNEVCNLFPHDGIWQWRHYSSHPHVSFSSFLPIFNSFSGAHFKFFTWLLLWKLQSRHIHLEFLITV